MKRVGAIIFCLMVMVLHADVQTLCTSPRVYLIPDFLSDEECDHIIRLAQPYMKQSTVVDEKNPKNNGIFDSRRSSEGMFLPQNPSDRILKNIEERIASLTGLSRQNGEALHVLHYGVGAQYEPHYDYFNPTTAGGAAHLNRGGQRVASVILYLNTPAAGGETVFPHVHIAVKPKKGTALLFYNCLPNGEVDPLSLHGGAPVQAGEKWIATKWIRFGVFN